MSQTVPLNYSQLPEQEYFAAVERTFNHFDADKDQHLNNAEFTKLVGQVAKKLHFPITEQLVDYLFQRVNQQGNGLINLTEFYSACYHYYYKAN